MQIANRLAGFSLGDADILRRAMGKKKPEEMAAQREKFLAGCAARQGSREKSREDFRPDGRICRLRIQQVALLRLRAAGVSDGLSEDALSRRIHGRACSRSETGNTEKVVKYINEARSMGITVLPPDVQFERPGLHAVGRRRFASACAPSRTSAKTPPRQFCEARGDLRALPSLFRILRIDRYAAF